MRFSQNIILNTNSFNSHSNQSYWVNEYLIKLTLDRNSILNFINLNFFFKSYKNFVKINEVKGFNIVNKLNISDVTWGFFSIFFLRKEKMYTKLKYSRVTQFDISSGAVAALFAGFIGFLISEKFGFELVDSGDFYFLFMYVCFLLFSLKMLLRLNDIKNESFFFFSLRWFFMYVLQLYYLFFNYMFK